KLNAYIDIVRSKVYDHHKKLVENNVIVTALKLKQSMQGIEERKKTLLAIFRYHNKQAKALVGKESSAATYERYETVIRHLVGFLKWRDNTDDINLKDVNHKFITDLEFYLKTERNNGHNTAINYMKNLKKITRIAVANGWLERDPFLNYKMRIKEVERGFLS